MFMRLFLQQLFLLSALITSTTSFAIRSSLPQMKEFETYDIAVRETWKHHHHEEQLRTQQPDGKTNTALDTTTLRRLVRYGTLAASSHNTQCWKFRLQTTNNSSITVLPDWTRRLSVVDPDDHHLYASLGCAVENIVVAANAQGLEATVDSRAPHEGIQIQFGMDGHTTTNKELFDAIPKRQTTRVDFSGQALTETELAKLQKAGSGQGVRVVFFTSKPDLDTVANYVARGNTAQVTNKAFVDELVGWVRFGDKDALETGDGLFGKSMGKPSLPAWLGKIVMPLFLKPKKMNQEYARQIHSSAGVAVFVSEKNDPVHWVEVGRCYERFALEATALGVQHAHINMPIEVAEVRPTFMNALGLYESARADLVVRFGRGPTMPPSLRRPLGDVILDE